MKWGDPQDIARRADGLRGMSFPETSAARVPGAARPVVWRDRGVSERAGAGPVELTVVENEMTDAHRRWLMLLDLGAAPEALRVGITRRSPDEASLVTLLRYLMRMGREVDHDRFDWVITYLFKRRLEQGEGRVDGSLGVEITAMFPDFPQPPLSDHARALVEELAAALGQIISFTTFQQLTASGLVEKGRDRKASFHEERYHPAVLASVVKYNVVLGKVFRKLFDEAAGRSRDLAAKLASADYRSNAAPLRHLAIMSGAAKQEYRPNPVVRGPMLDPAKELGLDQGREAQKLRFTLRSLVAYFELPANKDQNVARIGNVTHTFAEWEARALQTNYPEGDTSFRAQFAETLRFSATAGCSASPKSPNI